MSRTQKKPLCKVIRRKPRCFAARFYPRESTLPPPHTFPFRLANPVFSTILTRTARVAELADAVDSKSTAP